MLVHDAQREVRTFFIGGFWGQLVSSAIWLASAALGTWVTPRAAILAVVAGGFFIFPVTQLLLRLTGARHLFRETTPTSGKRGGARRSDLCERKSAISLACEP